MKKLRIYNYVIVMAIGAAISWVLFVVALAWSVMRYNYAKIPHDITIANSLAAIIVMGIAISAVPFMLACFFTYRTAEIVAMRKN